MNFKGTPSEDLSNFAGDPDYVAPDIGDYHIGQNADAIDKAVPLVVGSKVPLPYDIDDQLRPMGLGADVGADEAPAPLLEAAKTADKNTVTFGGTVVYSIRVSSIGLAAADDVLVTDTLPILQQVVTAQTSRGSVSWESGYGGRVFVSAGSIPPGEDVQVTVTAQVALSLLPLKWTCPTRCATRWRRTRPEQRTPPRMRMWCCTTARAR